MSVSERREGGAQALAVNTGSLDLKLLKEPGLGVAGEAETRRSRPQASRRSPGASAAADATPQSATSRWIAQVRGGAGKGENPMNGGGHGLTGAETLTRPRLQSRT